MDRKGIKHKVRRSIDLLRSIDEGKARDAILYSLSLPERAVRSGLGLAGGVAKETAELLVPGTFKSSKTYSILVAQSLDFLISDVGQVAHEGLPQDSFLARRVVGNFLELASITTLHVSPVILLAMLSDAADGSKTVLREIISELTAKGVIEDDANTQTLDELMAAISRTAQKSAETLNAPPLNKGEILGRMAELRRSLDEISASSPIPMLELENLWSQMRKVASAENVDLWELSTAMALQAQSRISSAKKSVAASARVSSRMLQETVFGEFQRSLEDINQRGFYRILKQQCRPYVSIVWDNFSGSKQSLTEKLVTGTTLSDLLNPIFDRFRRR